MAANNLSSPLDVFNAMLRGFQGVLQQRYLQLFYRCLAPVLFLEESEDTHVSEHENPFITLADTCRISDLNIDAEQRRQDSAAKKLELLNLLVQNTPHVSETEG
jgi:hypothetical protein